MEKVAKIRNKPWPYNKVNRMYKQSFQGQTQWSNQVAKKRFLRRWLVADSALACKYPI